MKNLLKIRSIFALVLGLFIIQACVSDDDYGIPSFKGGSEWIAFDANHTIKDIYDITGSNTLLELFPGDDETTHIIEGYVISSDLTGNFYKTISIQDKLVDPTIGIQIELNKTNLSNDFPVGSKVKVKLNGLYSGLNNQVVKIGQPFTNNYGNTIIGQLDELKIPRHVQWDGEHFSEENLVPVYYENIKKAIDSKATNTLIMLDNVQFISSDLNKTYSEKNSTTNRTLEDKDGNKIIMRNSNYASWAGESLPSKSGSVVCVLSKYNDEWQVYIRDLNDVKFDKPRFGDEPIPPDPSGGDGTKDNPYTVSDAIANQAGVAGVWVQGYIVGGVKEGDENNTVTSNDNVAFSATGVRNTSVLIADSPDVTDYSKCVIVNLPSGTIREAVNLVNNPGNIGRQLKVEGTARTYFGIPGVRDLTDYVLGEGGGTEPEPEPGDATNLFAGADFEDWAAFTGSLNSYGITSYASQAVGSGVDNSAALHLNGTPTGNDYVFTALAPSGLPTTYSKITFKMKGTAGKSVSLNVYNNADPQDYYRFNLGAVSGSSNIQVEPSANNSYTGAIDTSGQWITVTLNLSSITDLNTTNTSGSLFALKVGKSEAYNLYFDDFKIE